MLKKPKNLSSKLLSVPMDSWRVKNSQPFDRQKLNFLKRWWIDIDKINFIIIISIIIFGLVMTASSSPAIAKRIDVDKFFFLKKQLIFAIIATFCLVGISFLNQAQIKIFCLFGLFGTILLLILVLATGLEAKGAKRWLVIAGFTLQPSEFAKTFFIVFNAYLLQRFNYRNWQLKYGISAGLYLVIAVLLMMQPDFGMTLSLTILWLAQLFIYGIPLLIVLGFAALGGVGIFLAYLTFPHVADRIHKFLDAGHKNYQVERSTDAFINGSFFGRGPGNGVVKKFIPDAHTDFVFSVIGEEFGIVTCAVIILVFAYLITRIIKRAMEEENLFVYLSLCGLMMQFTLQVIVNIGVSLAMLPTKGMTLPFISYGGSSIISMALCFGLILSFTKKKYHKNLNSNLVDFI
jgi:cell division protein FtsW